MSEIPENFALLVLDVIPIKRDGSCVVVTMAPESTFE